MRKLVLALTATATLGVLSVSAQALPLAGSASVAPAATVNGAMIQKTELVVVKKRRPAVVVRRRPAVVVKKRRPAIVIH